MASASFLFLLFSNSENPILEIFSELHENIRRIFICHEKARDQRATWGAPMGQGRPLAADLGGPAGLPLLRGHLLAPLRRL